MKWLIDFVAPQRTIKARVSDELKVVLSDVDASKKLLGLVLDQDHSAELQPSQVQVNVNNRAKIYKVSTGSRQHFTPVDISRD